MTTTDPDAGKYCQTGQTINGCPQFKVAGQSLYMEYDGADYWQTAPNSLGAPYHYQTYVSCTPPTGAWQTFGSPGTVTEDTCP